MTTTIEPTLGQPALDVERADDGDLTLWSVTTIIGALEKPAFQYHAAEQAAIAAIDSEKTWKAMLDERGRAEAVRWLRDARFRPGRTELPATKLGTVVHSVCEQYALTGTRPTGDEVADLVRAHGDTSTHVDSETDLVGRMLMQFDGWLQRFQPAYDATEVCVYHPTYGYAGQLDAILRIGDLRFIADYKSAREPLDSRGNSRTPYPEVALQLAAYRYAEHAAVWRPRRTSYYKRRYYLLSESERAMAQPVPEVDSGLCIQITPESCEAYPVRCGAEMHRAFLHTQECFRWQTETARTAIGRPLEEP